MDLSDLIQSLKEHGHTILSVTCLVVAIYLVRRLLALPWRANIYGIMLILLIEVYPYLDRTIKQVTTGWQASKQWYQHIGINNNKSNKKQ